MRCIKKNWCFLGVSVVYIFNLSHQGLQNVPPYQRIRVPAGEVLQEDFFDQILYILSVVFNGHPCSIKEEIKTMQWVTRSHVHVDRIACPWLITRFVDSDAEFLFVPAGQIEQVVKETGAIPFDAPGVELGHHEGRCSFESIILKYGLKEPGLLRLAQIVHAADVSEDIDQDPIARGLEAIASGYSLRFPEDMENLEYQLEVYDSLYAWCRLEVAKKK